MPNTLLTPSIIAREACLILDNNLAMANRVYRDYEGEYNKNINGYKIGATLSVRKPNQFTVRTGAVASIQDVTEGTVQLVVNTQIGVDFKFTSTELTLSIGELSERVIKPAMVQIANKIDTTCLAQFTNVFNYPTTSGAGTPINSFAKFMAGVQRLNEFSVPNDMRTAVFNPADHAALLGQQTALFITGPAQEAYRQADLGTLADVATTMDQNVPIWTTGTRTNGTVTAGGQVVTYSGAQANLWTQSFSLSGLGANATINAGEVFTIAGVFAVNPVTKVPYSYLQQFVVTAAATATAGGVSATTSISPPVITSGAFQTVSAAPAGGATVTWLGAASSSFNQALMFHRNAFALAIVPMEKPPGAVDVGRETYKGISARVIPFYDGTNDASSWRLDLLFGVVTLDPRLATRLSG